MPRGTDYRIQLRDAQEAHRAHQAGWSIRAIARMRYREWGYASEGSAVEALRNVFRELDLTVRDRVEATVAASTIHGNSPRAARDPEHPDHGLHLAQRRHNRRLKREAA